VEFKFTKENLKRVEELKGRYPKNQPRAPLLMVLHVVQEQFGYVPKEMVAEIAEVLGIPKIWVEEVVTFYPLYRWEQNGQRKFGKNHLGVCVTLSCEMAGCGKLAKHVREKYGVEWDDVNADGTLSIQEFQCLGSCHTGPAVLFNDLRHEAMTIEKLDALLEKKGIKPCKASKEDANA
jgi:NADH:ubiquinone oxidoreductase subunit E